MYLYQNCYLSDCSPIPAYQYCNVFINNVGLNFIVNLYVYDQFCVFETFYNYCSLARHFEFIRLHVMKIMCTLCRGLMFKINLNDNLNAKDIILTLILLILVCPGSNINKTCNHKIAIHSINLARNIFTVFRDVKNQLIINNSSTRDLCPYGQCYGVCLCDFRLHSRSSNFSLIPFVIINFPIRNVYLMYYVHFVKFTKYCTFKLIGYFLVNSLINMRAVNNNCKFGSY